MITEIDDLSCTAPYDSLFDPDPPHSSTCQMFIDGQYIEVTPTEYAERFQELQSQGQAQMQEFRQHMEQRRVEAAAQHAQHPNMPNFCHECNRYYEFEATYPVEVLINENHVFLGDYKFGVGDTAYICTRCNEEIGEVEFMTIVKVHRFYPPR